ncbi:hypothetical protein YC2023_049002 [Brassica napus]
MGIMQDGKQARRDQSTTEKPESIKTGAEKYSGLIAGRKYAGRVKNRVNRPRSSRCLYAYGQDVLSRISAAEFQQKEELEVSQYLRYAHANRHTEGGTWRRMHSSHASSHLDVSGVLLHVFETCLTTCVHHVSPRMQLEACGLTYSRSGGAILVEREREVEKESKRFGAISRVLGHFRDQLLYRKSEEIVQKLEEALSEFRTVHSSPFEMSALGRSPSWVVDTTGPKPYRLDYEYWWIVVVDSYVLFSFGLESCPLGFS